MADDEFIFHNDCITGFNARLYSNILTQENITSKKKAIVIADDKHYGYFLEKDKLSYFMTDFFLDKMPFKIVEATETDYKSEVFSAITKVLPITIPAEKKMSFRELVDIMPAFKHSNALHFLLYKIKGVTSYVDRINVRISTDAGFGKDSIINIISQLVNSTVNLYGATFAKLEYVLLNKLIVLNEMGNLKPDAKMQMQEFLLATGAYFNKYHKRTRKGKGTQEEYDISNLSLMIVYNLPSYYTNKAQEYFDQMFTKAVANRFIPFVFEGVLTTQFDQMIDIEKISNDNDTLYKDVISTLNYYRNSIFSKIKYKVNTEIINFPDELKRYDRTFNTILKYVSEYANSQEEFDDLSIELFKCYKKYSVLLEKEKVIK